MLLEDREKYCSVLLCQLVKLSKRSKYENRVVTETEGNKKIERQQRAHQSLGANVEEKRLMD